LHAAERFGAVGSAAGPAETSCVPFSPYVPIFSLTCTLSLFLLFAIPDWVQDGSTSSAVSDSKFGCHLKHQTIRIFDAEAL
jgi:hypothetical protein